MMGLSALLGTVRASDVAVLDLERQPAASERLILEQAKRAEHEDTVDAVILGCAGMVNLAKKADQSLRLNVIEPVTVAVSSMKWLA